MVFCNLKNRKGYLFVGDLFGRDGVKYELGFDDAKSCAIDAPTDPSYLSKWIFGESKVFEQDDWDIDIFDNVKVAGLTCCAAVLIYAPGKEYPSLYAVGHPGGGCIDDDKISFIENGKITTDGCDVLYAVYATPTLAVGNLAKYKTSIEMLAEKCGTERVCVIDGFTSFDIFANQCGNLFFD